MTAMLYTIGHSTHPLEKVLGLLTGHRISAVADVRSRPYSKRQPQFNREPFGTKLAEAGIAYVFLGRELGARPDDPSCYVAGRVQFDALARSPMFQQGLVRVAQGLAAHRVALLCAEKDPLDCHRTILVCRHLIPKGITIEHVLADGTVESHDAVMTRLLKLLSLPEHDLLRTPDDVLNEAYRIREEQIAYNKPPELLPVTEGTRP